MFLDLAERVAGQLVDENERSRNLERREFFTAGCLEILHIDGARGDYVSDRDFATYAIGRGSDGSFGEPTQIGAGSEPISVAIGDVNFAL